MMPAIEDLAVMMPVMVIASLCRLSVAGETDARSGDAGGEKMAKHDASPFAWCAINRGSFVCPRAVSENAKSMPLTPAFHGVWRKLLESAE
jgi:hypothetical protein